MGAMGAVATRPAGERDVRGLARMLTRAFHDDPLVGWLLPHSDARRRRGHVLFEHLLERGIRGGEVYTTPEGSGAAVWHPPGTWRVPAAEVLRQAHRHVWALRARLVPGLAVLRAIEEHHPAEPHWYLAVLGTEPRRRGQGVASALLAPVLARCDAQGLPAYLETMNPRNLAFYRRHGFEVRSEADLPAGAPHAWFLRRGPRPA